MCQCAKKRAKCLRCANISTWRDNVRKVVPFQTVLLQNAKGNFHTLLLYEKFYILLDIIAIHTVCISYIKIMLYFISILHAVLKCVEFFFLKLFYSSVKKQYQKVKFSFCFQIHSWKEIFITYLSIVSWGKRYNLFYELHVTFGTQVAIYCYCINYELLFACKLQVTINCTNFELIFARKA